MLGAVTDMMAQTVVDSAVEALGGEGSDSSDDSDGEA